MEDDKSLPDPDVLEEHMEVDGQPRTDTGDLPAAQPVPPAVVVARIEAVVKTLLQNLLLVEPRVPAMQLATTSAAVTRRRLLHPREAASCVRIWRVLAEAHSNLISGRSATQREVYYALSDGATVHRAAEVNAAIADATRLLCVPRGSLGVTAASRGIFTGALEVREANAWTDLVDSGGRAIAGDLDWVASVTLRSVARYILVVEKDAVFNRLLQEKACRALQAVMLTARGQPDVATRAFLLRLVSLLPDAPVVGLVDYNPSGVLILSTYRGMHARAARTHHEGRHGVDVRWLCARSADVARLANDDMQLLSTRDGVVLTNLLVRFGDAPQHASLAAELREMARRGRKAELESLYTAESDLVPIIRHKLLRGDYV
jgi:meiotic recombination protein SPO11